MSKEVEPRFHFTGDDQALIDFVAPPQERESRQETGHQFATAIDKVIGHSDPEYNIDKTVSQYFVADLAAEHMGRRKSAAKEAKRIIFLKGAVREDIEGHFNALSVYFLPEDTDDIEDVAEYDSDDNEEWIEESLEKVSIFLQEGEELIDWMQRVADSIDRYYQTPEGQAEELHEARISNITELVTATLPEDNYLARIARSLRYGNSDEELESLGLGAPQALNGLMSYVMLRLNTPFTLRDVMHLRDPESIEKAHHRIINRYVQLPDGRNLFVAKAFTIDEEQLLMASISNLLGRSIDPEVTYFVTGYHKEREESGATRRVNETTYERSKDTGKVELYAGPPRHPAAHYFSHSLLHDSKGPNLGSYLRRLPVWPGHIKKLIDDINKSSE